MQKKHSEALFRHKSFQNERHVNEFALLNKEVTAMFGEIIDIMTPACDFNIITPSIYAERLNLSKNRQVRR